MMHLPSISWFSRWKTHIHILITNFKYFRITLMIVYHRAYIHYIGTYYKRHGLPICHNLTHFCHKYNDSLARGFNTYRLLNLYDNQWGFFLFLIPYHLTLFWHYWKAKTITVVVYRTVFHKSIERLQDGRRSSLAGL